MWNKVTRTKTYNYYRKKKRKIETKKWRTSESEGRASISKLKSQPDQADHRSSTKNPHSAILPNSIANTHTHTTIAKALLKPCAPTVHASIIPQLFCHLFVSVAASDRNRTALWKSEEIASFATTISIGNHTNNVTKLCKGIGNKGRGTKPLKSQSQPHTHTNNILNDSFDDYHHHFVFFLRTE